MAQQVPPRPTSRSPEVIRAAAEALAPEVASWCEESVSSEIIDGPAKVLRYSSDGYRLASELEDDWLITPDAELVSILDAASSHIWDAERRAVAAWAKANGITLDLDVGTVVETPHGTGPIRSKDDAQATYTVYLAENDGRSPGTYLGNIYAAEKCKVVEAA